ncbi:cytochrome P450 [filamentous cyanobacterium CCP1]|nr:cytochrome P450 [filamentous cyanobacterium CCP2]PSB66836.1 cytochrome P450 [filamentous cyanobacterium CCP1]
MKRVEEPKTPVFVQSLQWVFDPVKHLEENHHRHPDFFISKGIGMGNEVVITSHPQAMQFILSNDRKLFSAPGDVNWILEPMIGKYSSIMLDGANHKKRRQLVMPAFHGDRLRTCGESICQIAQTVMAKLPVGSTFTARKMTQAISLQVIFEVVFGLSTGDRANAIRDLLTTTADQFSSPLTSALLFFQGLQKDWGTWSPWGRFLRLRTQLDELLYAEIRDRRANLDPDRTDILSMLLAAQDEDGQPLSDQELRDELMTLLLAGHETTATALAWGLYWLHRQPEVKAKLLDDLHRLGTVPDPIALAQLPYLTAVCQETLRRTPVTTLTFPRKALEPVEIMGYSFPADTLFMGCMYLTHQREDLYPNPQSFRPERFLERKYSPYEFIPFGNGVRRCMGEALALYELKLALATIVLHYELELADQTPEVPRRRGVTLAPARGVKMVMKGVCLQPSALAEPIYG